MTYEELILFKKEVADPRMREIFANTVIPEGACFIDKVEIGFLDGRSCGFESVIEASGLQYVDGKVQEYRYSETDVSVDEFVEAHKGCSFLSFGALQVFDELENFEINTELWNHGRCSKVFDGLESLGKLDFRFQPLEFEKMKAIYEGSPLVSDGNLGGGSHWKAVDIDWDVECEEDLENLPFEIEIPNGMKDFDKISDYLSNETGFCHKGFTVLDSEGRWIDDYEPERDGDPVKENDADGKIRTDVVWFQLSDDFCVSVWYAPDRELGDQFQMKLELVGVDGSMGPGCELVHDESYGTADLSFEAICETLNEVVEDARFACDEGDLDGVCLDGLVDLTGLARDVWDAFGLAEEMDGGEKGVVNDLLENATLVYETMQQETVDTKKNLGLEFV